MKTYSDRLIRRVALLLGLAAGVVGCSGSHGPTSPTSTTESLQGAGGVSGITAATVRFYSATISPTSASAGSTSSYTLTLKNCDGSGGACGSSSTNNHQQIGSATVAVPAGFTVNAGTFSLSATGGKTWNASLSAGTITLEASGGTNKLAIGESVTLTFDAVAPCLNNTYTWTTHAYADTPLALTTPYTLVGTQPLVTVTGTCGGGCTLSQGYWKTHGSSWPVSGLTLGAVPYTASQLVSILNQPVGGNGLISLAYQLIAAKLNIANGADGSAVTSTISAADTLIGSLVVPPVGSGWLNPADTSTLTSALDDYSNGITGPGHCSSN